MKVAVITCSVGGIDEVKKPVEQNTRYDYFHYDENNLPFPLPNLSQRLQSKYLKCQTHRFLPDYDLYIWIDGRVEVIDDKFVETFTDKLQGHDVVVVEHLERKSVFEEMDYIIDHIKKGNHYLCSRYEDQQMEKELAFYEANKKDLKDVGLYAGGFWARWNRKDVNDCFDEWWQRTIEFSYFDQAMLAYVLGKYQLKLNVLDRYDVLGNLLHLGKHTLNPINLSYEDVYLLIKDHLRRKASLAVTRYGDGEAMMLDDSTESVEYKNHVFKRQLGKDVTEEEKAEITSSLLSAYKVADVIGIPTPRHKGLYWEKANHILMSQLDTVKDFCSIDLHMELLNNKALDKLLQDREHLFYISCHNLDEELKSKYNIKNVYSYIVAPELMFYPDYNGMKHYPDHFNKVYEWMDSVGCRGELCLVGAGVIGKTYNAWFKMRGGISIDLGSVFDLWAGNNTRRSGQGKDLIDNTYKL